MQWRRDEPPVGIEIEYERDDGVIAKGKLRPAGEFGIGDIARPGVRTKRQFVDEAEAKIFEVLRWRPCIPGGLENVGG